MTPSPGPTSDATGSFSNVQVVIPASTGAGATQLAVSDSASPTNSASGSITIYTATVSTSPTSGKAGTTFTVSGTGWPASESVTILFRDASTLTVTTVTCPTAAAASSTGALSGTCTVPALSAGITYDVFASDGQVRVRAGSGFTITS